MVPGLQHQVRIVSHGPAEVSPGPTPANVYPALSLVFLFSVSVQLPQHLRGFPAHPRLRDMNVRLGSHCHLQMNPQCLAEGWVGGGFGSREPYPSGLVAGLGLGLLHSSGTGTSVLRTSSRSLDTSGKVQNCLSG